MSLLDEPEYDAIALARQEDDPSLPRGVWTAPLKRADWQEAARLSTRALLERSKDLNLAAWLGEAWINLEGLAGGARATRLLQGLCERYWDGLHPLPQGGDLAYRTGPLAWIDDHWSMALLLRVPLIHGSGADARTLTLAQWNESLARENEERKVRKPGTDGEAPEQLTTARALAQLASMPLGQLQALLAAAREWSGALAGLHATLERLMGNAAPRLRRLATMLDDPDGVLGAWLAAHPAPVAAPTPTGAWQAWPITWKPWSRTVRCRAWSGAPLPGAICPSTSCWWNSPTTTTTRCRNCWCAGRSATERAFG